MQLPAWKRRSPRRADMKVANVPMRKWDAEIRQIPGDPEFLVPVRAYLENLHENLLKGNGLLLWGPPRSGKSAIATAVVREVAAHMCRAYWLEAFEMVDGWIEEDHRYDRMREAHLVVLDDLGMEGDVDFRKDVVRRALKYRLERAGATIITTNMNPSKLKLKYGEKMVALLRECFEIIEIDGVNWSAKGATV